MTWQTDVTWDNLAALMCRFLSHHLWCTGGYTVASFHHTSVMSDGFICWKSSNILHRNLDQSWQPAREPLMKYVTWEPVILFSVLFFRHQLALFIKTKAWKCPWNIFFPLLLYQNHEASSFPEPFFFTAQVPALFRPTICTISNPS